MDSIKIIKKHGQPGGLPVITAYVDADAPGESSEKKLYRHDITAGPLKASVITDSETPFTMTSFVAWLIENDYSSINPLQCGGQEVSVLTGGSALVLLFPTNCYGTGTDLKVNVKRNEVSYANGVFTKNTTNPVLTYTSYTFADKVHLIGA